MADQPAKRVVEFRVYIPKFDNSGNPIMQKRLYAYVKDIVDQFGGASVFPTVIGFFKEEDGSVTIDDNLLVSTVREFSPDSDIPRVKRAYQAVSPGTWPAVTEALIENCRNFLQDLSVQFGKEFGQYCIFQLLAYLEDSWCPEAEKREEASPSARGDPGLSRFYRALGR